MEGWFGLLGEGLIFVVAVGFALRELHILRRLKREREAEARDERDGS